MQANKWNLYLLAALTILLMLDRLDMSTGHRLSSQTLSTEAHAANMPELI